MYTHAIIVLFLTVLSATEHCKTPNNKEGECISVKLCHELLGLLLQREASATEYVKQSICEFNGTNSLVCCPSSKNAPIAKSVDYSEQRKLLADKRYCGYQHIDDYFRNGTNIAISEFPWQVVLAYKDKNNMTSWKCAGVLISNRYVLTVRHCIEPIPKWELFSVRLGEFNVMNNTDCTEESQVTECSDPPKDFNIVKKIPYPNNTKQGLVFSHDIALLRLEKRVLYSDYIRPICLPFLGTTSANPGDTVFSSGFGVDTNTGEATNIKKKISSKIVTIENCTSFYRDHIKDVATIINEFRVCTITDEDSADKTCAGDSGGAVMYAHQKQWHLEGLTSFGPRKCGLQFPEVHTKVSKYLDWILENIEP